MAYRAKYCSPAEARKKPSSRPFNAGCDSAEASCSPSSRWSPRCRPRQAPVEGTSYDPVGPSEGPSDRFVDFVEGAKLMQNRYAFVMVDLRGFGGSTGCLDWAGPGEQSDVVNAVKWAAAQPWSNGRVGMSGKSYDGVTGLIGVNHQPPGLTAVVSQEPVYDLYRHLYGDGIRRLNPALTPALYDLIDLTPGPALDDPDYNLSGLDDTQRPGCPVLNLSDQRGNDDHYSDYWRKRNLILGAAGANVPAWFPPTSARGSRRGSTCAVTSAKRTAASRWAARGSSTR